MERICTPREQQMSYGRRHTLKAVNLIVKDKPELHNLDFPKTFNVHPRHDEMIVRSKCKANRAD